MRWKSAASSVDECDASERFLMDWLASVPCPLLGVKRTSRFQSVMSAFDPKRTLASGVSHCRFQPLRSLS
jgi:hypothetical protein